MKKFDLEKLDNHLNYKIIIDKSELPIEKDMTDADVLILAARLCCMPFPVFISFCKTILDMKYYKDENGLPILYCKKNKNTRQLIKLLNKRLEYVMFEQTHPYDIVRKDGTLVKEYYDKFNSLDEQN